MPFSWLIWIRAPLIIYRTNNNISDTLIPHSTQSAGRRNSYQLFSTRMMFALPYNTTFRNFSITQSAGQINILTAFARVFRVRFLIPIIHRMMQWQARYHALDFTCCGFMRLLETSFLPRLTLGRQPKTCRLGPLVRIRTMRGTITTHNPWGFAIVASVDLSHHDAPNQPGLMGVERLVSRPMAAWVIRPNTNGMLCSRYRFARRVGS